MFSVKGSMQFNAIPAAGRYCIKIKRGVPNWAIMQLSKFYLLNDLLRENYDTMLLVESACLVLIE